MKITDQKFMEIESLDGKPTLFLQNYMFFGPQMDKLYEWADEHGCEIQGCLMTFPDDETFIYFKLEWG